MTPTQVLALGAASIVAGVVNAIAGGGTLFSFPAAIALGLPPIVANASNAVAMTPGSLASAWGYRRELARDKGIVKLLLPPAIVGGLGGAVLLLVTPERVFNAVVPALVLLATAMLLWQNLRGKAASGPLDAPWEPPPQTWPSLLGQLLVGIYGGYFGAGMGIMTLALLAVLRGPNIHRMNGVKIVLGAFVNGFASIGFIAAGAIDWKATVVMAVGVSIGGWGGAEVARRIDAKVARWGVVALGVAIAGLLARRVWFG